MADWPIYPNTSKIYCYNTNKQARAAKLLDTPYTQASGGGTLKFTPRIQAGNGTPA